MLKPERHGRDVCKTRKGTRPGKTRTRRDTARHGHVGMRGTARHGEARRGTECKKYMCNPVLMARVWPYSRHGVARFEENWLDARHAMARLDGANRMSKTGEARNGRVQGTEGHGTRKRATAHDTEMQQHMTRTGTGLGKGKARKRHGHVQGTEKARTRAFVNMFAHTYIYIYIHIYTYTCAFINICLLIYI